MYSVRYIERAETLGRKHNLTAEEPFEDAISRLSSLSPGPLSGVPISIKDKFYQEHCHTSGGLYWLTQKLDPHDSIIITQLRKIGAIPFIRGSTTQIMMWIEIGFCVSETSEIWLLGIHTMHETK